MPYLMVRTNLRVKDHREALLSRLSGQVAEALGKPERYVMVSLEDGVSMLFAGSADPTVYLELKSIGLPHARTKELSATLSEAVGEIFSVARDRVYIEFADAERHLWGWNGGTF